MGNQMYVATFSTREGMEQFYADVLVSLFLALLFRQDNTRQLMEKVFAGNGNFQGEEADRERS